MSDVENIPIEGREHDNAPIPGALVDPSEQAEPIEDEPEAPARQTPPAELAHMAEESLRIGIGFASVAAAALARTFERSATPFSTIDELPEEEQGPAATSSVALVAGAAAALTVELATAAIRAAESAAEIALPALSWFTSPSFVRKRIGVVEDAAYRLNERWSEARPGGEEIAGAFAAKPIPQIIGGVLDQLDLTELVIDRVDLARIIDSIDIDGVVTKVDLDAVVARIDVNEIAKGVDIEAIVERIDLVGLAGYVIDELDLLELIRQSTGSVAVKAAEGFRGQSINADRYVSAFVDRALRRENGRDVDPPPPSSDAEDER